MLHICPVVAKTGQVSSCIYSEKCRYSHDLEAFKTQVKHWSIKELILIVNSVSLWSKIYVLNVETC